MAAYTAPNGSPDMKTFSLSDGPESDTPSENVGLVLEEDAANLARMGYKQELKRRFSTFEVFGVAFSIMGFTNAIASTLTYAIPSGPAGMVWSWLIATGFIMIVGLAMADLASAMPTAGGLYWWTHYFASSSTRRPLSFLVGYSNTLGLICGLCGVDYGFSLMLLSIVVVAKDGAYEPTRGAVYGVYLGCLLTHGAVASVFNRSMPKIISATVVMNIAIFLTTIIALLVGSHGHPTGRNLGGSSEANVGHRIFAQFENLSAWPTGWTFMLAWLMPIWSLSAYDSCVHMSEEASNAASAVPLGIVMSIGASWILGFAFVIVLAACMNFDSRVVLDTPFGQPMAQIYYDALGKNPTIGLMTLLVVNQYLMGLSNVVPLSRQSWAFSRDGALPFSRYFSVVSHGRITGALPLRALWGCIGIAVLLGLLALVNATAAQALFSLTVIGNNLAYGAPIFSRIVWGQHKFKPGPFFTGPVASTVIAWVAIAFLCLGVMLSMFPVPGPAENEVGMNYAIVITAAVWGGALLYYFIDARHWFTGPKTTING